MVALVVLTLFTFDFLKVDVPAERSALGGSGICNFEDGNTIIENPAGLVYRDQKILSTSIAQYLAGTYFGLVSYQNSPYGFAINYFNSGSMKKTNEEGLELGSFSAHFINGIVGRGFKIEPFDIGVGVNLIYQKIDTLMSFASAINSGVTYNRDKYSVGLILKSIGYEIKPYIDHREALPVTAGVGFGYRLPKITILSDIEKPFTEDEFVFSIGLKGNLYKIVNLAAGYNSKLSGIKTGSSIDFLSGLSFGVSILSPKYHVAYGIAPHADLGLTNRLSFSIIF